MKLTKKQRARLVTLRNGLANLKLREDQTFDMNHWGQHADGTKPKSEMCGTAACAAGWGATFKPLRAQGLRLRWVRTSGSDYAAFIAKVGDRIRLKRMPAGHIQMSGWDTMRKHSFKTLTRFFGTALPFDPDSYYDTPTRDITSQQVATYIDGILAAAN